jgi:hypothetical protein
MAYYHHHLKLLVHYVMCAAYKQSICKDAVGVLVA